MKQVRLGDALPIVHLMSLGRAGPLIRSLALIVVLLALTARPALSAEVCGHWTRVPSPNQSSFFNRLVAVKAVAPNDVWTVGEYDAGRWMRPLRQTLIEHWDGSDWSIVPSPNVGPGWNVLSGIAVVSSDDIWAVGNSATLGGLPQTLVQHWDGARWNVIPSPTIQGGSSFEAVAAVSGNDIWAVGLRALGAPGPGQGTLIAHWDGSDWTVVPSPNGGNIRNRLAAIAVISDTDIWAVGWSRDIGGVPRTLILHWDGSEWIIVSSPNLGFYSQLSAVTGVSSNDIWASGIGTDADAAPLGLFLHWDSAGWNVVPSPEEHPRWVFAAGLTPFRSMTSGRSGERSGTGMATPGKQWRANRYPGFSSGLLTTPAFAISGPSGHSRMVAPAPL